jgi:hypothetical protein
MRSRTFDAERCCVKVGRNKSSQFRHHLGHMPERRRLVPAYACACGVVEAAVLFLKSPKRLFRSRSLVGHALNGSVTLASGDILGLRLEKLHAGDEVQCADEKIAGLRD